MLFTEPIATIEFEDVVRFCEAGNDEGFFVEYKREFPDTDKVAKSVAAFANTYGGLFIIGINAPNGKPIPPFEGFIFDDKQDYEQQIEQIILSHVHEPVFPDMQICSPRSGRTFIVVRVQES